MIGFFIAVIVVLIFSWITIGFTLATIVATIATGMFLARKFGIIKPVKVMAAMEIISAIVTFAFLLLFGHFSVLRVFIYIILRGIFLGIVYYDEVEYVYVTRIEQRED